LRLGRELSSHALPLAYHYFPGKGGDCPTMETMINKIPIDLKTKKLSTNNRFKQYLLADAGYCSKNNRAFLRSKGYTPLIVYNKRNEQDDEIIKANKFSKNQSKKYKKRFRIEAFFSWIKNYPIINQNYQKTIKSIPFCPIGQKKRDYYH